MEDATFDAWLVEKLNSLNLDEEIYSEYVKSVLNDGERNEDVIKSLNDLLSGALDFDAREAAEDILKVWNKKKIETTQEDVKIVSFDTWLVEKLNSLDLDAEVYSDYVKSVLDEGESDQELKESLDEFLSGVIESGASELGEEILRTWKKCKTQSTVLNGTEEIKNDKLKALIEQTTQEQQTKFMNRKGKNVDNELKQQLIAQYGEVSDGEESDDDDDDDGPPSTFVNVNAKMVTDKIQQEREKAKKEFEEKKARDKMNLAKDKSRKEDRKDKEKARTQKGERRAR